jgi:hypothetical protein
MTEYFDERRNRCVVKCMVTNAKLDARGGAMRRPPKMTPTTMTQTMSDTVPAEALSWQEAGETLLTRARELVADGAITLSRAMAEAQRERPDLAQVYATTGAPRQIIVRKVGGLQQVIAERGHSPRDVRDEVARRMNELRAADASLTASAAYREVLRRDPSLAAEYNTT